MAANKERTFIAIKPDGVQRGLIGKIVKRFEERGFKLVALKMCAPGRAHMEKHYADLKKKPFFKDLVDYMISGPVVCMVWEGLGAVKCGRMMLGETNPQASLPGSIRGDMSIQVGRNICHGSDSVESAQHEIALWFKKEELVNWNSASYCWIYEEPEEGAAPAKAAPQGPVTAMTEAQLIELDNYLVDKSYITGYTITQDDVHEFSRVKSVPTGLVNLARWHRHVASYSDDFSTIPGDKRAPPQGCPAEYVAQAEAPAAEESDDDVDLFGSDDEEDDAEAERIKAERVAAYNKKKEEKESKKGKVIAKSNVIMDIKPWDDETDMKELEAAIRSITMDGLLWGTGKLVEIGYGIKKLQITTVIEDDKVMMDDLEEQIIAFEDFVQSMDIVAFNKI
jgi:nucleoside diphosphate kinase/translation elongation factor EF-1beta